MGKRYGLRMGNADGGSSEGLEWVALDDQKPCWERKGERPLSIVIMNARTSEKKKNSTVAINVETR